MKSPWTVAKIMVYFGCSAHHARELQAYIIEGILTPEEVSKSDLKYWDAEAFIYKLRKQVRERQINA